MQTEIQTIMDTKEHIAPDIHATSQGRQTFDLPGLITDFCSWYRDCLADKDIQLHTSISANIPRYVQGNRLFMKHLLFEVGKCSLLTNGVGEISVKVDALQHTRRRHSLTFTISLAEASMPFAREKKLFQAGPVDGQSNPCRFRSANFYYAQMIAESFGGDIHIDNTAEFGLRYLVGISIFTRPS